MGGSPLLFQVPTFPKAYPYFEHLSFYQPEFILRSGFQSIAQSLCQKLGACFITIRKS